MTADINLRAPLHPVCAGGLRSAAVRSSRALAQPGMRVQVRCVLGSDHAVMAPTIGQDQEPVPRWPHIVELRGITPEPGEYLFRCRGIDVLQPIPEPAPVPRIADAIGRVALPVELIYSPVGDPAQLPPLPYNGFG